MGLLNKCSVIFCQLYIFANNVQNLRDAYMHTNSSNFRLVPLKAVVSLTCIAVSSESRPEPYPVTPTSYL